ncbi:MAG: ABC transporter permease subunit [Gaiellales bacterium]
MRTNAPRVLLRLVVGAGVLGAACLLYSAYRELWARAGWTWPFAVDDVTMPPLTKVVGALFDPVSGRDQRLIGLLWHASLFTAKEAAVGFAAGSVVGFLLGAVIAHFRVLKRGLMPYVVASQTIPILAIAPMVVVGLGNVSIGGWTPDDWVRVSVIAAYLTFFPVTVNTVRGLESADPRAIELMKTYAASDFAIFRKLRVPSAVPYLFGAFRVAATASVVGAIVGELPSSIQGGLGGAIINFNQYYALAPANLWATNLIAAALGITFFLAVVLAEKLLVHRPPEQLA